MALVTLRRSIYVFLALLAAGGVAIVLYVRSGHADSHLRQRFVTALTAAMGRPVELESLRLQYLPPGAVAEGFRSEGPVLTAERVEASFSFLPLLRGRVVISDLDIYRPLLQWDVDTESFLSRRPDREEGRFASRVDLARLSLREGQVIIGSLRRTLSLAVEGLSIQADNSGPDDPLRRGVGFKGPWTGTANFTKGSVLLGDLAVNGMAGSAVFLADPNSVQTSRLRLTATGVDVRGSGEVLPGAPARARFQIGAQLDPESSSIARPLRQFSASRFSSEMSLDLSGGELRLDGSYIAEAPTFDLDRSAAGDGPSLPWRGAGATGTFAATAGKLEIHGRLELLAGGEMEGSYLGLLSRTEPAARRRHEVSVRASGIPLKELVERFDLPGDDRHPPSSLVGGGASMRWQADRIQQAEGSATLTFAPAAGPLPMSGAASLSWLGRRVTINSSSLQVPGSDLELAGRLDGTGRSLGLELSGELISEETTPLAVWLETRFHLREGARRALLPTDLSGRLNGRFDVTGTSAWPQARGSFESDRLEISLPTAPVRVPAHLDAVAGTVSYRPDRLRAEITRAEGEGVQATATVTIDPARAGLLEMSLDAAAVPAAMLAEAAGLAAGSPEDLDVRGSVQLTARLAASGSPREGLRGPIELRSEEITAGGPVLKEARGRALLDGDDLEIEEVSVSAFDGNLRLSGRLDLSQGSPRGKLAVRAERLDLAAVDAAYSGPSLTGLVDAQGEILLGEQAATDLSLAGSKIVIGGIDLGDVTGSLTGQGDSLHLRLVEPSGVLTASADFLLQDPADGRGPSLSSVTVDGKVTAEKFSLELLRPLLPPGALAGLRGEADGTIVLSGPLLRPAALEVHALLDRISLTAGDYPLHSDGPVRLTVADGFLTLASTRLVGEKTDLRIGGSMVLGGQREVTARVEGIYDLGLAEILFPEIRASGPGTADLRVIERGDTLTYFGQLTLDGATLVHPSLPLPIENLRGKGEFTEEGLFKIVEITGGMGGGHVAGSGWARFAGAAMPQLHLSLVGSGIRAELLPELRAFFDSDISLDKVDNDYRMSGRVTIQRAIYSRPFGVEATAFQLRNREFAPLREPRPGSPTLSLDLDIVAEQDVWVRNEEALIEASAHLSLDGTLDKPELSGRISALEGGTYRFRGVTYRIVGGALDFADVNRIDPLIDIEAATHVQQYEITLRVTGRFSRPVYDLTSEPALPQRDIVWLLITGRTLGDATSEASRTLAEGQVAAYLAAPVAGAVSGPLERVLGVSSVQIDPYFLQGTADPTARLTVTKRVGSSFLFTYSSSLGQSGQEIYQMQYNPARLWDVTGTRDLDGSIGADVRFRRRWRGWDPLSRDLPAGQAGQAGRSAEGRPASPAGDPPGPARMRVGRIRVVADRLVEKQERLIRRLHFDEGDPLRRGDLLEGREILRQHYARQGYPAAHVEVIEKSVEPSSPATSQTKDIEYAIRAGPLHDLRIVGDVRRRPIRAAVRDAWQEPILVEDLAEEARRAALGWLKGRGFYSAAVDAATALSPAATAEAPARLVTLDVKPGPKVRVSSIQISGNREMSEERIRRQMLTREKSVLGLFNPGLLKESVLADDIAAIRALYVANGYLSARVAPPAIALSPDGEEAEVTITIAEEGPQSRVAEVSLEGEVKGVEAGELIEKTQLEPGQILTLDGISFAADRLRETLDLEGYSRSRVSHRLEGPPEQTRVIFTIVPQDRLRVAGVIIEGNIRTRDRIVAREVTIDSGDYLSRGAILTTQRNLYRLGLFRSVQIDAESIEGRPGFVNVRVRLQEGTPILTAWGVGYDSEDHARASFEIGDNNLFGTRRSAALFLRNSTVDRRAQITLRDPNLFGERIETLLSAFVERREFESFDVRRRGGTVQLSRRLGAGAGPPIGVAGNTGTTLFGRYRLEDVDLFDLQVSPEETGEQALRLGSAAVSITHDTRDDIINPMKGSFTSGDVRLYHQVLGSEEGFLRLFASHAAYREIGRGFVWAYAVRAGTLSSREIPISERFFAGGDTTLRGFPFNTVGPEDPDTGKPVGGNGLFLLNQEMRFPIYKALKGVAFYDAGNVFARRSDYDLGDLRHVGGLGLRIDTPVGPLRIEYGRKLDRERGENPGEIFFSIGQAF